MMIFTIIDQNSQKNQCSKINGFPDMGVYSTFQNDASWKNIIKFNILGHVHSMIFVKFLPKCMIKFSKNIQYNNFRVV